jgi:hypothetical protein
MSATVNTLSASLMAAPRFGSGPHACIRKAVHQQNISFKQARESGSLQAPPNWGVAGGGYVVTTQLPERDGAFEYRIKSISEPHERVVRESELVRE